MRSDSALDALEQARYDRETDAADARLIHHSDRGGRYLSLRYTERLAAAGLEPSVDSRGDAYDTALAETVIGLFKTDVIHRDGPWRDADEVEYATLTWVAWYKSQRLMEPLSYVPPAEYAAQYTLAQTTPAEAGALNEPSLRKIRGDSLA
jgi:transposase InsO family protein